MKRLNTKLNCRAQMGVEYLLILTVVAIIALGTFGANGLLANIYRSQSPDAGLGPNPSGFFSKVTRVIQGESPQPINGGLCPVLIPGAIATCECPAPAFGGNDC